VLGLFRECWKRKQITLWKRQIRRLAQSLGEARDDDVLIEFLVSRLASVSDPALVPGVAALLNHFEQQRKWLQPRVLRAMDRFEKSGVLETVHASFHAMLAEAKEESKDVAFVVGERARGKAAKRLRKKQKQLLRESAGLVDPEQHELHHAMRIAAKHLRYTLELARPIYAGALADADEAIRKLQTLLGEIHDCDVWVASFEEFAEREAGEIQLTFGTPQPFERLRPGLDCLCQERRARRRQVFDELAAFWQELKEREIWDRLEKVLERSGTGAKGQELAPAKVVSV
jgi:CHAD domain-containing protein